MKPILTSILILLTAGAGALEPGDYGGTMGVFFSDTEFSEATANLNDPPTSFSMYVVLVDLQVENIAAYECGLAITDEGLTIVEATWPFGGENWGGNWGDPMTNHVVVFGGGFWPVPPSGELVVSTLTALWTGGSDPVDIIMGPSTPSSGHNNPYFFWDGPVIVGDSDPDLLLICNLTSGAQGYPDVVATINGGQPVAVEGKSLSGVRSLFE